MDEPNDTELNASEQIDRLMRRALLWTFAAGIVSLPVIWTIGHIDGTLDSFDRIAYPILMTVFSAGLLALWHYPRLLNLARWIGYLSITGMLMVTFWIQISRPIAMAANYNVTTLLGWLPLAYVIAFLTLQARQAYAAAATIFCFLAYCAVLRSIAPTEYASQDRSLMINTLVSHAVLIACLKVLFWLKFMIGAKGEQAIRLNILASTDPLTGLANRRWVMRKLDEIVARNRLDIGSAVLLADLDFFKRINDNHGHEVGDQVLKAVSDALRSGTRQDDLVARWGGEEFLVLLHSAGREEALELAERLRARVEALVILDGLQQRVPVTMSMGVASFAEDASSASWVRRADEALYQAKDSGRNCCVLAGA